MTQAPRLRIACYHRKWRSLAYLAGWGGDDFRAERSFGWGQETRLTPFPSSAPGRFDARPAALLQTRALSAASPGAKSRRNTADVLLPIDSLGIAIGHIWRVELWQPPGSRSCYCGTGPSAGVAHCFRRERAALVISLSVCTWREVIIVVGQRVFSWQCVRLPV